MHFFKTLVIARYKKFWNITILINYFKDSCKILFKKENVFTVIPTAVKV